MKLSVSSQMTNKELHFSTTHYLIQEIQASPYHGKGSYDVHAARVSWLGEIKEYGSPVNSSLGVRPAMMISY